MNTHTWELGGKMTARRNALLASAILLLGAVFIVFSHQRQLGTSIEQMPFNLGVLLEVIGLGSLILGGEIKTVVDPQQRVLRWSSRSHFGSKERVVAFSEVSGAKISTAGNKSKNGFEFCSLVLQLKDNSNLPTGYTSTNRVEAEQFLEQLQAALR